MSLSENDQNVHAFVKHFQHQKKFHKVKPARTYGNYARKPKKSSNDVSSSVSWPIFLAIIPTLGTFFAGSAEMWSDFIMIFSLLYYVYKWMTVPWSYYESARSRRITHQKSIATEKELKGDGGFTKRMERKYHRHERITAELRRHELAGLIWVVISPAIAGYSLQYSRLFLSNVDRYISAFNVTIFILAASIRPLSHIMTLLQERTLFLQSEASIAESQVQVLQTNLELLENKSFELCKAFATKKDLDQMTEDISPTLHQLAKSLERSEKRYADLRRRSEEQFTSIDLKMHKYDQYILYRLEQSRQEKQAHAIVVGLILLPLNISLWVAKRMTSLLPLKQGNNLLINLLAIPTPVSSPPSSDKLKLLSGINRDFGLGVVVREKNVAG